MGIYSNKPDYEISTITTDKLDENSFISISSTNDNDYNFLNEGTLFLSKTGKEIKEKIKAVFKKYKEEEKMKSISNKKTFSPHFSDKSSSADINKCNRLIKSIERITSWKLFYSSGIQSHTSTLTVGYAPIIKSELRAFIVAAKDDKIYNITISYSTFYNSCSFDIREVSNCIIPIDVIKVAADNSYGFNLQVFKSSLDIARLDGLATNRYAYNKVIDYCNKKYPELHVAEGKFLSSQLKFSKK